MAEQQQDRERPTLPTYRHALSCGCFSCAEWRAAMRRRGWTPVPARDWRGVELT